MRPPQRRAGVPNTAGVDKHRMVAATGTGAADQIQVHRFRCPHGRPAELDRRVTGLDPAPSDLAGFRTVPAEQDGRIGANAVVPLASEQLMDRGAGMLSLQVPQSQVNPGHCRNRNAAPSEIDAAAVHLVPEPFRVERVLAEQQCPQAAGLAMTERRVDDRLGHFRAGIDFADAFEAGVGPDTDEQGILSARSLVGHVGQPQYLSNYTFNLHCETLFRRGRGHGSG